MNNKFEIFCRGLPHKDKATNHKPATEGLDSCDVARKSYETEKLGERR